MPMALWYLILSIRQYSMLFRSQTAGSSPSLYMNSATLSVVPTKFFDGQPFICIIEHPSFANGENATRVILAVRCKFNLLPTITKIYKYIDMSRLPFTTKDIP